MTGVLRAMSVADLDAVLSVQREGAVAALGHLFPQQDHPFPADEVRTRWREELSDRGVRCFVVLAGDRSVAGFAATRGDELLHFGTAPATWGTGLAGIAHDEVLGHLAAAGYGTASLWVFEDNEHARRFYARRGWRPTGERTASAFAPYPVLLRYGIGLPRGEPPHGAAR